jgi:hypothetical protein
MHGLNGIAHDFAGGFVFPGASLLQRPIEGNGSRLPTIHDTAAAVPAFIGMQDDRRVSFFLIRDKDIHLADIDADIASCAEFGIKNDRRIRGGYIRQSAYFDLGHSYLPL